MRKYLMVLMLFLVSASVFAQKQSSESSAPEGRYEIVQSTVMRSLTFKLDKYTGTIWQYVKSSDGTFIWEKMERTPALLDRTEPGKINYQIFMGSHAAADCFLINVNTGTSWILVEGKDGYRFWEELKQV